MGGGEWLAVPLFAIACQKSFLWRRGTGRPAGRLRFISPPPTPRRLPPKARKVGSGLDGTRLTPHKSDEDEKVNDEHARHDEGRTEPRGAELRRHLQANSAAEIEK